MDAHRQRVRGRARPGTRAALIGIAALAALLTGCGPESTHSSFDRSRPIIDGQWPVREPAAVPDRYRERPWVSGRSARPAPPAPAPIEAPVLSPPEAPVEAAAPLEPAPEGEPAQENPWIAPAPERPASMEPAEEAPTPPPSEPQTGAGAGG